ncbi:MAG: DinB family protein [Acidobacteriota bacterium]|nr:DinB family protein [Acidobacteriota bacterium]
MNTTSSAVSPSPLLSSHELSSATHYLNSTRDSLLELLSGLSDRQWHFKPADDRWSIAEILEHIVLIEASVQAIIGQMQDAPLSEPDRINSEMDEIILAQVPKRSTKAQAPPQACPSHRWSPAETLARFVEGRTRTLQLLVDAPFLRGRVIPHPILGPWDGYQWILAAAAHGARHTDQMLEVKACPGFPEAHAASPVSLN